jgi:PPOX class probable F420-dependent enzyme
MSSSTSAVGLSDAKYISLRSFKKNGQPVDTPVWFAALTPDRLVVFTDGTSYKVKRIRRNPTVEIARCDMRGKLLGPWQPATCRAVEAAEEPERVAQAYAALNHKYGLLMRTGTFLATISGRAKRRLILEIALSAT